MSKSNGSAKIPERSEIKLEDTWNLEVMFASPEAWDAEFGKLDAMVAPIVAMKGKLSSAAALRQVFEAEDVLGRALDRLHAYASQREDEDTANSPNQARIQRLRAKMSDVFGATAWVQPEILENSLESLEAWAKSADLAQYRRSMTQILRSKPHTLSKQEETLLSLAGEVFSSPHNTYSLLVNADMKFPDVVDEKGVAQPLSNGRYIPLVERADRGVRQRAFTTFYDRYIEFRNTLASTLAGKVKYDNYNAKVRGFGSALEASLHPDNVPVALYDALSTAVQDAMPAFGEYLELRREVLGLSDMNMWDVYVPIVPDFEMHVDWNQALEWVRESCEPLGEEYLKGVDECFNSRWIDVYENRGKRSGAYSGGAYGTPPYILMNYQGTLDHVFTLTHELGHSMHSWLANKNQRYRESQYPIFTAEIASTTNEGLLHHYLLKRADDPRMRAFLLNHLCDQFRGTVYRQTMFATFERIVHEMDQRGEPLVADALCDAYYELNRKFFPAIPEPDKRIAAEWSRIPHFYYNFYVYKYATGFCAAQVFARRIMEGGAPRDQYLDMLRAGGSDHPLDVVRRGGVDLTDPKVLTGALTTFREAVQELRGLLAPA